jgi:hypothetical protein
MTSLILDCVATAYLYLGISTGEKVMIILLSHLSQDRTRPDSMLRDTSFVDPF